MANKRFNQITRVVTSFDSNDVLPIGNITLGDGKMSKDTLLELTAQNALAGNVAPAFDPTRTNENPYKAGESVAYEGKTYTFKVDHYGAWAAADVDETCEGNVLEIAKRNLAGVAVVGYRLNISYNVIQDSDYGLSELVAVSAGDSININPVVADSNAAAVVYDTSLSPLTYYRNYLGITRTIPENGAYIRFSVHKDAFGKFNAIRNNVVIYKSENIIENLSAVEENVKSTNKFIGKMTLGYYLNTGASLVQNSDYAVSDYVEVTAGSSLEVNFGVKNSSVCMVFYNSDKLNVSYYVYSSASRTVTVPANSAYVRFSVNLAYCDVFVAKLDGTVVYTPSLILQNALAISKIKAGVFEDSVTGDSGYLNASGVAVSSTGWYHSDFIEIPAAATDFEWSAGIAEYNATLCLYDSGKNFGTYYRCSYMQNKRTIAAGTYAFARLSFYAPNALDARLILDGSLAWQASVTDGLTSKCDKALNQGAVIRFGCYNTGTFDGADMVSGSEEVAMAMRKALSKAAVNVLATQEDIAYFNPGEQTLSKDECFGMFAYYQRFGNSQPNYKAVASDFEVCNFVQVSYSTDNISGTFNHPYFLKSELDYCGLKIVFISVHFDWTDNTRRQEQIRQVVAFSQNYDNVIVAGDFNPENCINGVKQYDPADFAGSGGDTHVVDNAIFIAGGFTPCNDGYFGTFGTYIDVVNQGYEWPCDNIMVKTDGHLKIKNVGVIIEEYMTDHAIFWADVTLY